MVFPVASSSLDSGLILWFVFQTGGVKPPGFSTFSRGSLSHVYSDDNRNTVWPSEIPRGRLTTAITISPVIIFLSLPSAVRLWWYCQSSTPLCRSKQQADWLPPLHTANRAESEREQWLSVLQREQGHQGQPPAREAGSEGQEGGGAEWEAQSVPGPGEKVQAQFAPPTETTPGPGQSRYTEEESRGLLAQGAGHLLQQQSPEEEN